jgi:hypothetical protein
VRQAAQQITAVQWARWRYPNTGPITAVSAVDAPSDDQPMISVASGPGTDFPSLEQDQMLVILGTGKSWQMTVASVRIWQ